MAEVGGQDCGAMTGWADGLDGSVRPESHSSAFISGTDLSANLSQSVDVDVDVANAGEGYAQGYGSQANYEILSNFEENINYGDYYNYYSNYYHHLQVKGQPYLPLQTQSQIAAIESKANTRELISKALARHQSKVDAAKDEEEEEGQIPASPRAFNKSRTPSTSAGSVLNARYSRSKSPSRSRSVSKERPPRSKSRSRSRKRYISRSRSRSPRRRHRSRSRSRSPYFGPIIKDYRRGRRGYARYPRGFRDRGSRTFRRGHPGYNSGYYSHSRRHEYSRSHSRSISPKRRHMEIDKLDHSDEEQTMDSRNSEILKPSDINMSEKRLTQSFLAMLEEKQKRAKMIPIVTRSDASETDDRRHGFVNTFNSVAGKQSDSGKHTLSYDLESEGWQVVDDANADSKQVCKSAEEDDYKEEEEGTNDDFDTEHYEKPIKRYEDKSDSSDEQYKSKRKKSKKQKKRRKRKASTSSDSSESDSDNENADDIEKKKKSKKKKKIKKRKRKVSSSSSSSDYEEKTKRLKKKKKKRESSSESEDEDKREAKDESVKDLDKHPPTESEIASAEGKDISKAKDKKKKHKSDSSDSDSNNKKKKKSKKKISKKRKHKSSSSSSSDSSDSSDSDSRKKKKKKKSKKSKNKKHKKKEKKEKEKNKVVSEEKKRVKHEMEQKEENDFVVVMSMGEPPLQLKWPKQMIKQTYCSPSLQYSINPKVTVNASDFKEVKIHSHSFESSGAKESTKLVSEYERFIDELNPDVQSQEPYHRFDSFDSKLRDKAERQDVMTPMTSSERRALEKLKKQSLHSYDTKEEYRRHEELKSAPMNAYYSAKVHKTSPLKLIDNIDTKSNKSTENDIKSNEAISLSIEERPHKRETSHSEVDKSDDQKRTAQELLERVKQRRHSSKDGRETNREARTTKQLPHIGKMKAPPKRTTRKGAVTTANADSTQTAFVSQPMTLDMNYDYNWYYNYYLNSAYGVAQYPQANDPTLASAYYAYYSMLTSNDYNQSDLNDWAKQHGLTFETTQNIDSTDRSDADTNTLSLNRQMSDSNDSNIKSEAQTTGPQTEATEGSAANEQIQSVDPGISEIKAESKITNDSNETKSIEVLVSVTASDLPEERNEESKDSPDNAFPFASANFQHKVKVRVTASSLTDHESRESLQEAVPPPPPPPRPLITRLISTQPVTLPNGQVLPSGTKQVVVHPYHTEDPNQFTAQWFVDAFNSQKTSESSA